MIFMGKFYHRKTLLRSLYKTAVLFGVFFTALGALMCKGNSSDVGWTRYFYAPPPAGLPLTLAYVSYADDTLTAAGVYRYAERRGPVVFRGKKEVDGMFRPIVTYEVATLNKTQWEKLRGDVDQQPGSESIDVSPKNPTVKLCFDMKPFRDVIGSYRYGRLVLETGDSAVFELDDLLPTADDSIDNGNFKEDFLITDDDKKANGFTDEWLAEPADLITLTSLGGRLVGDFLFQARSAEGVILEGTRTLDGNFWPKATLQAATSDKVWRTIGKSEQSGTGATLPIASGTAERIRILLSDYKPLMGNYKYGRVVFSNGQAGVFSIDLLDPKKSSLVKADP